MTVLHAATFKLACAACYDGSAPYRTAIRLKGLNLTQ